MSYERFSCRSRIRWALRHPARSHRAAPGCGADKEWINKSSKLWTEELEVTKIFPDKLHLVADQACKGSRKKAQNRKRYEIYQQVIGPSVYTRSLEVESGFHQYWCSGEKFLVSSPSLQKAASLQSEQRNSHSAHLGRKTLKCSQRYANWKEHLWHCMTGSEWSVPEGVPEGQKTWHKQKPPSTYWLLQLQPVWVESNIETLSMLIYRFFYVIHHDYKAVRRLLLLLIVCLSSLKCDSGVMDNCTAILTTVSSILSFSSFNNVHYYCSHIRAPTNTCPCRDHIRQTSEEAGAVLEVDLWRTSMVEVFLHGRLCVA